MIILHFILVKPSIDFGKVLKAYFNEKLALSSSTGILTNSLSLFLMLSTRVSRSNWSISSKHLVNELNSAPWNTNFFETPGIHRLLIGFKREG